MLFILYVFTIIIFYISVFIYCLYIRKTIGKIEYLSMNDGHIPKIIWSYWEGQNMPDIVQKSIESWKRHNPSYNVNVLNSTNLIDFINPQEIKSLNIDQNFIARKADFIRLFVIEKYGGIWMDSSIICNRSLDWLSLNQGYDLIGYSIPYTPNTYKPIIENWFFAAPPNSILVKAWLKESKYMTTFKSEDDYVTFVKNEGKTENFENLTLPYLVMHLTLARVYQANPALYKVQIFDSIAEDGPFRYLHDVEWNSEKAIINFKNGLASKQKLVKIRGMERKFI
jgi:hypothetical protein